MVPLEEILRSCSRQVGSPQPFSTCKASWRPPSQDSDAAQYARSFLDAIIQLLLVFLYAVGPWSTTTGEANGVQSMYCWASCAAVMEKAD